MKSKNRLVVLIVALTFIIASCSPNIIPIKSVDTKLEKEVDVPVTNPVNEERFNFLLDNKKSGGPPPDGIPPIEEPDYITVEEASPDMESSEPVFVLELENGTYIYPQRVLVWHEIVNLVDKDVALTYCPLTGSAITYKYPENSETTFGTSGSLINSNLLMYDRHSDSFISQIDGVGLDKDLKGVELETLPTFWMEWQVARKSYPDAKVLSTETGFIRNYNNDPYGSYVNDVSGNYYVESSLIFPALNEDEEKVFQEKYSVIGIKDGLARLALDPKFVKDKGVFTFNLNGKSFISFYDESISNVRIYHNELDLSVNTETMKLISKEGLEYKFNGQSEDVDSLTSPIYFEVMWFAWFGFYPDTEVIYE